MTIRLEHKSISQTLFIYWFVLVVWQNISSVGTRSGVDIVLKIGLLSYLTWSFLRQSGLKMHNFCGVSLFLLTQVVSLLLENEPTFSVYISYIYTGLIVVLVFGIGKKLEVTKKELTHMFDAIIAVSLYAAIYALIFCTSQFKSAFSITSAYGNELSSFFSSSHEYALYMAAAIIGCVVCLDLNRDIVTAKRFFYIVSMAILVPNLILTFSRTVLLGTMCFFIVYVLGTKNSKIKKWIIIACIAVVTLYIGNLKIRSFVDNIVFKGNKSTSRNILFSTAIELFSKGNFINKTFGYGINYSRNYMESTAKYGSVHNAYLQVLLYFGIIGLSWLIIFLIVRAWHLLHTYKQNRYWCTVFFGLLIWAATMMITNTFVLFTSSIDCYFLTMFAVIVPMFATNSINAGNFEKE